MKLAGRAFREQSKADFRSVGAIAPSSRWLAAALVDGVLPAACEYSEPRCLLEVGAGTGAVTTALAAVLGPCDTLLVVEQNATFAGFLESRIAADPAFHAPRDRVRVLHASVKVLEPVPRYHGIVSSLPFNSFTADEVAAYLDLFGRLLLPGGQLRFFEYLAIRRLRAAFATRSERQRLAGVDQVLSAALVRGQARSRIVWWNLPPAVVHVLEPGTAAAATAVRIAHG